MQTTVNSYSPVTLSYWNSLKGLGENVKRELIALLTSSIGTGKKAESRPRVQKASRFYGAWKDNKPAEELMDEIRKGREFETREILPLN